MIKEIKLKFNLNIEKAILMILKEVGSKDLLCNIDCSKLIDTKNIEEEFNNKVEPHLFLFKNEIIDKIKELKTFRKELNQMMTHEVYEYGEELGLWKIKERQKRLI